MAAIGMNPSVVVEKGNTVLNEETFYEYVPKARMIALAKSGLLPETRHRNDWGKFKPQKGLEDPRKHLAKYRLCFNPKNDLCKIQYVPADGNMELASHRFFGRVFCKDGIGLCALPRGVRNTLIDGLYVDLDLANAQPQLLYSIVSRHLPPSSITHLTHFCQHRDDVLAEIQARMGVDRSTAKVLPLVLFFGGSINSFIDDVMPHPFPAVCSDQYGNFNREAIPASIHQLHRELSEIIIPYLQRVNPVLRGVAKKRAQRKQALQGYSNERGTFLSLYLQTVELRVIDCVLRHLLSHTSLLRKDGFIVCSYEFDGFKILKENYEAFLAQMGWQQQQFLEFLSGIVKNGTGIEIAFDLKPTNDKIYDISSVIDTLDLSLDHAELSEFNDELLRVDCDEGDNVGFGSHAAIAYWICVQNPATKDNFFFVKGTWYCWNPSTKRWDLSEDARVPENGLKYAIMRSVPNYINEKVAYFLNLYRLPCWERFVEMSDEEILAQSMELTKDLITVIRKVCAAARKVKENCTNAQYIKQVVDLARSFSSKSDVKFDDNRFLLGFPNGVFDFQKAYTDGLECAFREYEREDRVTMCCGVPYRPPEECEKEIAEMEKLCRQIWYRPEIYTFCLRMFATCLIGIQPERFFVLNGSGGNGKGVILGFLAALLSIDDAFGYAYSSLPPSAFVEGLKTGGCPEVAHMHKKRAVWSEEPESGKKLNNDTVKAMTGGGTLSARKLYSSKNTVELHATVLMLCNKKPLLKAPPTGGDERRYLDVPFESEFTHLAERINEAEHVFKQDTKFKDPSYVRAYCIGFFHMLLPELFSIFENNSDWNLTYCVPQIILQRSEMYLSNCYGAFNLFLDNFIRTGDESDSITLRQILERLRATSAYKDVMSKGERGTFTEGEVKSLFQKKFPEDFKPMWLDRANVMVGWVHKDHVEY